jgi:hypothetical protein
VIAAVTTAILPNTGPINGDLALAHTSGDSDGVVALRYRLADLGIVDVELAPIFFPGLVQTGNHCGR